MACSSVGSTIVSTLLSASIVAFESIVPVLESAGAITTASGQSLETLIDTAVSDLDAAIADIKSSTSTLSAVEVLVQDVLNAYEQFAAPELPPGVTLYVIVAGTVVESLLRAIQAEIGPAPAATAANLNVHGDEKMEPSIIDKMKLDHLQGRMQKVQAAVAAAVAKQAR